MRSWGSAPGRKGLKLPYGDNTLGKAVTNITHLSLEWNPQGAWRKGRPKKSWRRTIQQDHNYLGTSWNQVKRTAQNRSDRKLQWRPYAPDGVRRTKLKFQTKSEIVVLINVNIDKL